MSGIDGIPVGGYLFIDPGLTSGLAYFDDDGDLIWSREIRGIRQFFMFTYAFLKKVRPKHIAYERFNLSSDPKKQKAQTGSNMPATQIIGQLEGLAELFKVETVLMNQSDKEIGYRWYFKKPPPPKSHMKDEKVALSIGMFWLVSNKIKKL